MQSSAEYLSIGPTDEEVEAWASRERQRRVQWSSGPTPEQAALWASRERDRRIAEDEGVPEPWNLEAGRAVRNVQLAAEGAWSLLRKASVKTLNRLVEAGYAWEDGLMVGNEHSSASTLPGAPSGRNEAKVGFPSPLPPRWKS